MTQHDNSYKLLFSHPEMVRDLLSGFVNEPWLAELDLTTLEKVNGSYVTDDLRDREDDIIWRVSFKGRWLYLYILLEFQSSIDAHMAVRILTYLGLLYQDLIKQKSIPADQKLPPILPIVLYNGKARWRAATDIQQLIEDTPTGLSDYIPRMKYLLLDEGAIDESGAWELKNLVAALFKLEKSGTPAGMEQVVSALIDWLGAQEQISLRRAFVIWIKRVLLPGRMPGVSLPDLGGLLEIKTMLAETVVEWTEQWKQQGLQQGLQEGRQEGHQQGLQQGKLEGEIAVLERLITKRFGPLTAATKVRLQNANLEQLEIWSDRFLDSPTLAALFDEH